MADWAQPSQELTAFVGNDGATVRASEANPLPVELKEQTPTIAELLQQLIDELQALNLNIQQLQGPRFFRD